MTSIKQIKSKPGMISRRIRRAGPIALAVIALGGLVAGCGTGNGGSGSSNSGSNSSGSSSGTGGSVVIDIFNPFSGTDAALGNTFTLPGALAGAAAVNAQGGILGKKVVITHTDSRGDPADAVPAANQLVATNPPSAIIGPTTDTGLATIPIFNQAKIVMMSPAGEPQLDSMHYQYLFRPLPPDSTQGIGMAIAAMKKGYKRAALVFGSNSGSQTMVPALIKTFEAAGGKVVFNDQLASDQPSYQTDVAKMLAAKPDVIFTASDAQTAATFFSELKQTNGLTIPIIGSQDVDASSYLAPVEKAVGGASNLMSVLSSVDYSSTRTNGNDIYKKYFLQSNHNNSANLNAGINPVIYDEINILALAMTMAHSTVSKDYVGDIRKITNDPSGVHVDTYAQGLKELKAGKSIYWDGAGGTYPFNSYGYVPGSFEVQKLTASGTFTPDYAITTAELNKYIGQ